MREGATDTVTPAPGPGRGPARARREGSEHPQTTAVRHRQNLISACAPTISVVLLSAITAQAKPAQQNLIIACVPVCLGTGAKLLSRGTGFGLAHSHAATPSSQQLTD